MAAAGSPPSSPDRNVLNGLRIAATALVLLGPDLAIADDVRSLQLFSTPTAQAPSRAADPNVFDRIGHWFGQFGDRARGAFRDAAHGMTGSVEAVAALPNIRILSKRQRCEPAANGVPDCRRAAETACRNHGYASGKSLETQSERVCAPPKLFSQQASSQPACRTESYVLRSICQ